MSTRGSIGMRQLDQVGIFAHKSSGVLPREDKFAIVVPMSCRVASYGVRGVRAQIDLSEDSVARVALPDQTPASLGTLESARTALKRCLVVFDPTERCFGGGTSLAEAWRNLCDQAEAVAAVLHTLEGLSEREVFKAYSIAGHDL